MAINRIIGSLLAVLFLCQCAGPSTPFGAISLSNLWQESIKRVTSRSPSSEPAASIRFLPPHQRLHTKSRFTVMIEDPRGLRSDHRLTFTYNGIDMTEQFMSQANKKTDENRIKVTFPDLRLPAHRGHEIEVTYYHSAEDESPTSKQYLSPTCPIFTLAPLRHTEEFKNASSYIELVRELAEKNSINPNFLAGLIAQESGFNPRAVSVAKALGLTQVTSLGEADIIQNFADWPRYPDLDEMPVPLVKLQIMTGAINANNEWRLNPKHSIMGGIAYLQKLREYWQREETRQLLAANYDDPNEIMTPILLASYNSGAFRVNSALRKHGNHWLKESDELTEARKYVARITSFCDAFASGDGENYE